MTTNGQLRRLALALSSATLLTLTACGGGSSDAVTPPATPMSSVPVTVIDDAIRNAKVCLDVNRNGVCDAGEPSGTTDATGNATLSVATADVGKYPVLAEITTASVDAKYGPISFPFTLQAPADKTGVVSPLTTLVQTVIANSGASSADAEASVKAQTGLNVSLFQDFTKSSTPESAVASTVARMVVVVTQAQSSTLQGAKGSTASDGTVIKQSDLDKAIQQKLLEILPNLLIALSDPSLQTGTDAQKAAALLALAQGIVASADTGIAPAAIATVVAINNQTSSTTAPAAVAPKANVSLTRLMFSSLQNWSSRANAVTLAQNTPDAAGNVRYTQRRSSTNSGATAQWSAGGSPIRQSDLHFNGSTWMACALNQEHTSTLRDAAGRDSYNYCQNYEIGTSKRADFDVSGKTMASVLSDVRAAGYTNILVGDGTTASLNGLVGTATFPAGSQLRYQQSTPSSYAPAYYPGLSSKVTQYSAGVSAGGVVANQAPNTGCNSAEFSGSGTLSTTLESLMAVSTGTPCVYGQRTFRYPDPNTGTVYTSDPVDEGWGNSTVGIGTLGTANVGTGTAPGFYSGNTKLRIAFKGPGQNPVTYYACKERFNTGSPRNCTSIGTGSYTITTLGDARILTLNSLPAQTSAMEFARVLVERGGAIYSGYQNKPTVSNGARLNTEATNALLTTLGLPAVNPDVAFALTAASYQGSWDLVDNDPTQGFETVTMFASTASSCSNNNAPSACTLTITNPATGAFTMTESGATATGTFNFITGAVAGTYSDPGQTPSSGSFTGARR